jgi:mannose/fructose/N-acetylgalactosamine-specific phosphotransferase system component IID
MNSRTKIITAVIGGLVATVVAFPFLVPSGCTEVEGVSSWKRCTSFVGTPAFSVTDFGWDATLDVIQPVLVGLLVGLFIWWLVDGPSRRSNDSA